MAHQICRAPLKIFCGALLAMRHRKFSDFCGAFLATCATKLGTFCGALVPMRHRKYVGPTTNGWMASYHTFSVAHGAGCATEICISVAHLDPCATEILVGPGTNDWGEVFLWRMESHAPQKYVHFCGASCDVPCATECLSRITKGAAPTHQPPLSSSSPLLPP